MKFQRGAYGEIVSIYQGDSFSNQNGQGGIIAGELFSTMSEVEREMVHQPATLFIYQQHLWGLLSQGQAKDPLYRAVIRGEPLSLYPIGNENVSPQTFVPILRRIGEDQWQIGIPEAGRSTVLTGEILAILPQAWLLCATWLEAERTERARLGVQS